MKILDLKNNDLVSETYRKLISDLCSQNLEPGTRIKPISDIAKQYQVSYLTAQKAIKLLQREGKLSARRGDGVYITSHFSDEKGQPAKMSPNQIPSVWTRSQRNTKNIGVVMPFWAEDFEAKSVHNNLKGILHECERYGWPVELIHNKAGEAEKPHFINKIVSKGFSGVVWLNPVLSHKMNIMRLVDKGIDVIVTARPFPDLPVTSITPDHYDLAEKICSYCLKHNIKNIAVFSAPIEGYNSDPLSVDIIKNIQKVCAEKGIDFGSQNICPTFSLPMYEEMTNLYLRNNPDIEAFLFIHEILIDTLIGYFRKEKITKLSSKIIFNIFGQRVEKIDSLPEVQFVRCIRPDENIGKAAIFELEKRWVTDFKDDIAIDLSPIII